MGSGHFCNVSELAEAGVHICFSSGNDPSLGKDLDHHAGRTAPFGLDSDEANKALTFNLAKIFGVDDRIGNLKVGKASTSLSRPTIHSASGQKSNTSSSIGRMWI
jgi:imidazolonepropionase-like amidohydrolase